MAKICLDLDGVLGDLRAPLGELLKSDHGIDLPDDVGPEDWRDFLIEKGVDPGWDKRLFDDEWFWSKVLPIGENIEAAKLLTNDGHVIFIATSRPKSSMIPTKAWLKKHGVPYEEIRFVRTMSKFSYMQEIQADCVVEDLFYEAYKCAAYGFLSFVIETPYNVKYKPRVINKLCVFVRNLHEVREWLDNGE